MSEAKSRALQDAWSTPQKRSVGSLQYGQRRGFQIDGARAAWHATSPQLLYLPNGINDFSPDKFRGRADDEVTTRPSPAWLQRVSAGPETPALWEGLHPVQPVWSTVGSTPGFHTIFGDSLFGGVYAKEPPGPGSAGGSLQHPVRIGPLALETDARDRRQGGLLIDTHDLKGSTLSTRSSRYNGVYKLPSGRWRAQLTLHGTTVQLGNFGTESDAALAHDKAVVQVHGSSQAGTNFWVHPATAAAWLKERMSKNLANAMHEIESVPEQQKPQRSQRPQRRRKQSTGGGGAAGLSAMAAAAAAAAVQEVYEEESKDRGDDCYEQEHSAGRPAHRRRKK